MKKVQILCIDDQPAEVTAKLRLLQRKEDRLTFELKRPTTGVAQTAAWIRQEPKRWAGILVDLRLDGVAEGGERAPYNAPTLAQDLRSRMASGEVPSIPIVLWTLPAVRKKLYDRDRVSHDLFDSILIKDELEGAALGEAARLLVSLADGYLVLRANQKKTAPLKTVVRAKQPGWIDRRADALFMELVESNASVSDLARFVRLQIVEREGLLIAEDTLCARLGVGVSQWRASPLRTALRRFEYVGPFCSSQKRWWWRGVDKWWQQQFPKAPSILSLDAPRRVALLSAKGLVPPDAEAKRIAPDYSTRFTVVCAQLRLPLDPIDGYLLKATDFASWHDRQYVSREVVRHKAKHNFDSIRLDVSEKSA